jgi:hypothetical protein
MPCQVFISYSHASDDYKQRVRDLVLWLRAEGISVIIDDDKLPGGPDEGWPLWCESQVKYADKVLIACDEGYARSVEPARAGDLRKGVVWEARVIQDLLFDAQTINPRFRPVLLRESDDGHVPQMLQRYHHFRLYAPGGPEQLLAWLRGPDTSTAEGQQRRPAIRWPSPAADYTWPLADRKAEFALFEKMLTGQCPRRILLLEGASNTGKTAVLAEMLAYSKQLGLESSLLNFKGTPGLHEVIALIRDDLRAAVASRPAAGGPTGFVELIQDLEHLTEPLLLVFDTYEQASADAQRAIEGHFLQRLDRVPAVVVVIGGQKIPEAGKYTWGRSAEISELRPINQADDWFEFSQKRWKSAPVQLAHLEALTAATGGNPGAVSALLEKMVQNLPAGRAPRGSA